MLIALAAVTFACGSDEGDSKQASIRSIEPSEGTARGGDTITIRGMGFDGATRVLFGDTEAAEVTFVSSEVLEVVSPMHLAGEVDVVTSTSEAGQATAVGGFEYLPLALSFRKAPPWYLPSFDGLAVSDAVSADFDADGDSDVLVAVRNGAAVLLENSGNGSFAGGGLPPDQEDAGAPDGGDDGGTTDAGAEAGADAGADASSEGGESDASDDGEASGDAGFGSASSTWIHDTRRILAEDFDADGVPDVFLCNGGGQAHRLFRNDGTGGFELASGAIPDVSDECLDAVLADMNGDSLSDLVVLGRGKVGGGKSYVRVYLRKDDASSPAFALATELEDEEAQDGAACGSAKASPAEASAESVTTDDLAAQGSSACEISYEAGEADATILTWFAAPSVPTLPESIELDLRAVGGERTVTIQVRDANGEVFSHGAGSVGTSSWKHVATPKLGAWQAEGDGDGVVDEPIAAIGVSFAASASESGSLLVDAVDMNVKTVGVVHVDDFERKSFAHAWGATMSSLSAGDLNGDGLPELLVGSDQQGARALRLLRNDTEAGGSLVLRDVASGAFDAIEDPIAAMLLLDADEDGDLDVVAGAIGGQDRFLANDGNAHFFDDTLAMMPVDRVDARSMAAADMDMDGRPDLLVANRDAVNRIYVGRGAAGYRDDTPAMPLDAGNTLRMLPLDADADGDLDIFVLGAADEPPTLLVSVEEAP